MTEEQAEYNKEEREKKRKKSREDFIKKRKELMKGINPDLGAFLCDNPLCQYSDQLVPKNAHIQILSEVEDGDEGEEGEEQVKQIQRHYHRSKDGKFEVHFCTICHNAIEMVHKLFPDIMYNGDITALKTVSNNEIN